MDAYKIKLLALLLTFNIVAIASENDKTMQENIISLATIEVKNAIINLGNTIKKCDEKKTEFTLDSLNLPNLNEKNMMIAFIHLSSEATKRCESGQWEKLSYALGNYNNVISHFKATSHIKFEYEELLNMHAWSDFKFKIQYNKINKIDRKLLESNKRLLQPFDHIKSFSELSSK